MCKWDVATHFGVLLPHQAVYVHAIFMGLDQGWAIFFARGPV